MIIKKQAKKRILMLFTAVLTALLLIAAVGCSKQPTANSKTADSTANHTANSILTYENENGELLYSFVIPKSIFGEKKAEDVAEQFNRSDTTVLLDSGEEMPAKDFYTDITANEDGTATFVFTAEQLEFYLQETRRVATLNRFIREDGCSYIKGTSIISTEFTDDDLTGIIVYVDGDKYTNESVDNTLINSCAGVMGLYQIMSGVGPYEWRVNVTVKDYKTGEIISESSYPTDR